MEHSPMSTIPNFWPVVVLSKNVRRARAMTTIVEKGKTMKEGIYEGYNVELDDDLDIDNDETTCMECGDHS
jgi:hypothetical protein